jgi:hypothetical protein
MHEVPRLASLLVALAVLAPTSAGAQSSVLPHRDCPEGSRSVSGPSAEWEVCEPVDCSDDSSCSGGTLCREAPLCVNAAIGGVHKDALGPCTQAGSCTYPASCESGKRCVKVSVLKQGLASCGCHAAGTSEHHEGAVSIGLALALAAAVRRGRRSPSHRPKNVACFGSWRKA